MEKIEAELEFQLEEHKKRIKQKDNTTTENSVIVIDGAMGEINATIRLRMSPEVVQKTKLLLGLSPKQKKVWVTISKAPEKDHKLTEYLEDNKKQEDEFDGY